MDPFCWINPLISTAMIMLFNRARDWILVDKLSYLMNNNFVIPRTRERILYFLIDMCC